MAKDTQATFDALRRIPLEAIDEKLGRMRVNDAKQRCDNTGRKNGLKTAAEVDRFFEETVVLEEFTVSTDKTVWEGTGWSHRDYLKEYMYQWVASEQQNRVVRIFETASLVTFAVLAALCMITIIPLSGWWAPLVTTGISLATVLLATLTLTLIRRKKITFLN